MLTKVKEYMLKNIDDQRKSNGYWRGTVLMFDRYGIDEDTDCWSLLMAVK